MKSRLAEIAEFAGVSTATVGRVLNGRPGIAAETRDAVLTALDVFGFERPERFRTETAGLVGLVVPDLQNPIFPAFAEAVSLRLVKAGLMPVLCTRTADTVSEAHYIRLLLKHDVAGILFIGAGYSDAGPEYGRELRRRRTPLVLINPADANDGACVVSVDDASAVDQALAHLWALGHERIALIAGPVGHVPSARKLGSFRACHERLGRPEWRDLVAHTGFSIEGGMAAASRLLATGGAFGAVTGAVTGSVTGSATASGQVTAFVCASDALALGAIRAARRGGRSVPDDVSVIGFDDSAFLTATDPPLTTLRQPIQAMAAAAVEVLLAQIGGNVVAGDETMFEPELIVRASTRARRPPPVHHVDPEVE